MGTIAIAWWFAFLVIPILSALVGDPVLKWGRPIGTLLSSVLIIYIILRVSRTQADFRWSDLPESERPYRMRRPGPPEAIRNSRPSGAKAGTPPRPDFLPPGPPKPKTEAETSPALPEIEGS